MKSPVQYQGCALRNIIGRPNYKIQRDLHLQRKLQYMLYIFLSLKDKSYVVASGTCALLEHCPDPL